MQLAKARNFYHDDCYVVDFSKTFGGVMLIGVNPKMARADKANPNSPQEQAHNKDGVLKWTVTVSIEIASFGNKKYENIPITVTSREKPLDAILPGTPVTVEGLELGISTASATVRVKFKAWLSIPLTA